MDLSEVKSTDIERKYRVVVFLNVWSAIDSLKTHWLLGLDKATLTLVIGFIKGYYEIRSLTETPAGLLKDILR